MSNMGTLVLSILVTAIILSGPLLIFAGVKLVNSLLGGLRPRFIRIAQADASPSLLGLLVQWDSDSFPHEVTRIKVDYIEVMRGGRSTSFSYTFEDKSAKKRSFMIPLKLESTDLQMLTDLGPEGNKNSTDRSYVLVEVESRNGDTTRRKIRKAEILDALSGPTEVIASTIDALPAANPDSWALHTRVFPWKVAAAEAAGPEVAGAVHKTEKKAKGAPSAPTIVDFIVTKVWIEPGCIVCDACENEAPQVFKVLADTCIVKEGCDLSDGASIKAAAEGCPVDVIKYTKVAKSA